MIIVHIIVDLNTGGAEGMLKRLVEAQAGKPDVVNHVISLRGLRQIGATIEDYGVSVQALGFERALDLPRTFIRLVRLLRQIGPDVVQTWMYHADLVGGLAARFAGFRHLVWGVRIADISREMGVPQTTLGIRWMCARLSSLIPQAIVYVAHSARSVHEQLGYAPNKGRVIPNGYPRPKPSKRGGLRTELGLNDDAILIGTAGRFTPQKDPKGLITIGAWLCAEYPDLRVIFLGRGYDRSNSELVGWIEATGMPDRFSLLGERSDLETLYPDLDVFCLKSIGEGFPNVIAEAMSAGVPCVATNVGDTAYLLDGGGIVVPPDDLPGFAGAVRELIDGGSRMRRAVGRIGQRRIKEHFDIDVVAAEYEALYVSLTNRTADLPISERAHSRCAA